MLLFSIIVGIIHCKQQQFVSMSYQCDSFILMLSLCLVGKHGTCSYPVIQDEYTYFAKAFELYFKYNISVSFGEFCTHSLLPLIVEYT